MTTSQTLKYIDLLEKTGVSHTAKFLLFKDYFGVEKDFSKLITCLDKSKASNELKYNIVRHYVAHRS